MYKFRPVITSVVDVRALADCVDLTNVDKYSSKLNDKLSFLASSMFGFNSSVNWINITFYYSFPTDILDGIRNFNLVKIESCNQRNDSEGFMTGSISNFIDLTYELCKENKSKDLRQFGNLLHNYLKSTYNSLYEEPRIKTLSDNTFILI